jgi:hypothetical protein
MGSHRKRFLHNLATFEALLRGEARVDSYHCVPSSFSLFTQDSKKRAPRGVHDALCQGMVLYYIENNQVLNSDHVIAFGILLSRLILEVSALTGNLEMGLGCALCSFPASVTALLTPAHHPLLASQGVTRGAIEARVRNGVAFTIGQEGLQPYINADVRMRTVNGRMRRRRVSLTDDESVPVSISTQDEMDGLGSSPDLAVQFDLEEVPHLLRDDEVFLILMQIAVLPILPQLNGVPAIGLLETGKPDTSNVVGFGRKEPLEGLGETVSEHLYRCGRHMFTLPFECCLKLILTWKCPILLILRFDGLKHAIINDTRLTQASYELAGLLLIHKQAVLKCSHENILPQVIRKVKRFVEASSGFSPPRLSPGALKPCLVEYIILQLLQ